MRFYSSINLLIKVKLKPPFMRNAYARGEQKMRGARLETPLAGDGLRAHAI